MHWKCVISIVIIGQIPTKTSEDTSIRLYYSFSGLNVVFDTSLFLSITLELYKPPTQF